MSPNVSAQLPVCTRCHLYVPLPPPERLDAQPQPPPRLGTVGPMNRCLESSGLRCRGPSISRKKGLQLLESAPLIQTVLHSWGLSKYPINKKWQLAGFSNQRPRTALSPLHLTSAAYLSIFLLSLFLHFIILLLSLPPTPVFSPLLPEKHISIWHRK